MKRQKEREQKMGAEYLAKLLSQRRNSRTESSFIDNEGKSSVGDHRFSTLIVLVLMEGYTLGHTLEARTIIKTSSINLLIYWFISGSNVSEYIGMVCDTLRSSIPKAVLHYQVREARKSLLNHFYAQIGRKEKEQLGKMLDEDPELMGKERDFSQET